MRRELSSGGAEVAAHSTSSISELTLDEIHEKEEALHHELLADFERVSLELDLILDISAVTFIFPLQLLCRYVGAKKTGRVFNVTTSDYLDIVIFIMVAWLWDVIETYKTSEIREHLFGPLEDKRPTIRFLDNVIYDITHEVFHLDYFVASITALLWFRANL